MSKVETNDSETEDSGMDGIEIGDVEQNVIDFIRERPWTCVLGAAGLGFVIARLLRGDR